MGCNLEFCGILWLGGDWNIWITLWLFNIAMQNGPLIDDFPIKPSIYKGFSMAMLNNQMVFSIQLGIIIIPTDESFSEG